MGAPARFTAGVTNASPGSLMAQFGMPDPTKWHVWFDDFDTFTAAEWTITTTEAGASSASEAITPGDGGVLLVTNDSADNDADFFQGAETFRLAAGKKLFFKTRIRTSDATQSDIVIGLQITDTAPLDVTDGVFFLKPDDAATLNFLVEKDNTATTQAAVTTLANDTWVDLGFYYDGKSTFGVFVNDVQVASVASTNMPDDEDLAVSFGIQNGAAAAKTLSVDYILVAKER